MKSSLSAFFNVSVVLLIAASATEAWTAIDDEVSDDVSYETIVDELQKQSSKQTSGAARSTSRRSSFSLGNDPFENVWIHAGVGFAQTTQNLSLPNGIDAHMSGRGIQAAVGIDILGPNLAAEGAVRTFGESEDSSSKISLKEFDLKVLFKLRRSNLGFRAGGGLSARYMTVRSGAESFDVTTPASIITVGGDIFLTPSVSLGLDLGTRNAMISETFDKTSFDGTIRLDTHF